MPNLLWVGGFDGGDRDEDNKMLCFGGRISGVKALWGGGGMFFLCSPHEKTGVCLCGA